MASAIVTALLRPMAVPIIRPAISPIAQPVRQCRVAFAAMLFRESMVALYPMGVYGGTYHRGVPRHMRGSLDGHHHA